MREGRRIDVGDVACGARVCLLSGPLADRFFKGAPAVGQDDRRSAAPAAR